MVDGVERMTSFLSVVAVINMAVVGIGMFCVGLWISYSEILPWRFGLVYSNLCTGANLLVLLMVWTFIFDAFRALGLIPGY